MSAKTSVVEDGIDAVTPRTIKLAASIADKPAQWIVNFLLIMAAGFIGWAVTVLPDKIAANTQVVRDDFSAILKSARDDYAAESKRNIEASKEKLTMVLDHNEKINKDYRQSTTELVSAIRELKEKLDRGPRIKTDGGAP